MRTLSTASSRKAGRIDGSFAFVTEGEQSRDKFMSSGQNVAIKAKMMGYYLFRRCEENRVSA